MRKKMKTKHIIWLLLWTLAIGVWFVDIDTPKTTILRPYIVEAKEIKKEVKPKLLIQGKASYYSHAGCLGCSKNQTMANGEKFDENKMTLAIGRQFINGKMTRKPLIALNKTVKVCSEEKCITARITDTGGFYTPRFGFRVADLSLGLAKALNFKTDKIIKIYEIL